MSSLGSAPGQSASPPPQSPGSSSESQNQFTIKVDQIAHQIYRKVVSIITYVRLTKTPEYKSRVDRWYNLELEDPDIFREELRLFRSLSRLASPPPTLYIDVILDAHDLPSSHALVLSLPPPAVTRRVSSTHPRPPVLLERWSISFYPNQAASQSSTTSRNTSELPSVYKHCILLCRTVLALATTLPTHALVRRLRRHQDDGLRIGCRLQLAGSSDQSDTDEIPLDVALPDDPAEHPTRDFECAPVRTPLGVFVVSCTYRVTVSFASQGLEAMLSSRFLADSRTSLTSTSPASRSNRRYSPAATGAAFVSGNGAPTSLSGAGSGSSVPRYSSSPRYAGGSFGGFGPSSSLRYTAPHSLQSTHSSDPHQETSPRSPSLSLDRISDENASSHQMSLPNMSPISGVAASSPRPPPPFPRYSSPRYTSGKPHPTRSNSYGSSANAESGAQESSNVPRQRLGSESGHVSTQSPKARPVSATMENKDPVREAKGREKDVKESSGDSTFTAPSKRGGSRASQLRMHINVQQESGEARPEDLLHFIDLHPQLTGIKACDEAEPSNTNDETNHNVDRQLEELESSVLSPEEMEAKRKVPVVSSQSSPFATVPGPRSDTEARSSSQPRPIPNPQQHRKEFIAPASYSGVPTTLTSPYGPATTATTSPKSIPIPIPRYRSLANRDTSFLTQQHRMSMGHQTMGSRGGNMDDFDDMDNIGVNSGTDSPAAARRARLMRSGSRDSMQSGTSISSGTGATDNRRQRYGSGSVETEEESTRSIQSGSYDEGVVGKLDLSHE